MKTLEKVPTDGHTYSDEVRFYRNKAYSKHVLDYDDVKFELLQGDVNGLIVPTESVQGCWGPGTEIAITPHTLRYEDAQTTTITEVTPGPINGTSKLIIEGGIIPPTTMQDAEANLDGTEFAVEVALLNRNVEIRSDSEDDSNPNNAGAGDGGYVQVLHTPGVPQHIEGVELRYMGQQKSAGRFVSCICRFLSVYCCTYALFTDLVVLNDSIVPSIF